MLLPAESLPRNHFLLLPLETERFLVVVGPVCAEGGVMPPPFGDIAPVPHKSMCSLSAKQRENPSSLQSKVTYFLEGS